MISCRHLMMVFAVGLGCFQGCSETSTIAKTIEVAGAVTLDGKPLTEGTINFTSASTGDAANASLGTEGRFLFASGVLPGTYRVTVTAPMNMTPPAPGVVPPVIKFVIPAKYTDPAATDLKATVAEGADEFKFDLKS